MIRFVVLVEPQKLHPVPTQKPNKTNRNTMMNEEDNSPLQQPGPASYTSFSDHDLLPTPSLQSQEITRKFRTSLFIMLVRNLIWSCTFRCFEHIEWTLSYFCFLGDWTIQNWVHLTSKSCKTIPSRTGFLFSKWRPSRFWICYITSLVPLSQAMEMRTYQLHSLLAVPNEQERDYIPIIMMEL